MSRAGLALAAIRAFQLETVRIEEEYSVIVVVILSCRIDDRRSGLPKESLKCVDLLAAVEPKGIVMEADIRVRCRYFLPLVSAGPIQNRVLPLVQPMASSYSSNTSKPKNLKSGP